jgi:hypothetical protein
MFLVLRSTSMSMNSHLEGEICEFVILVSVSNHLTLEPIKATLTFSKLTVRPTCKDKWICLSHYLEDAPLPPEFDNSAYLNIKHMIFTDTVIRQEEIDRIIIQFFHSAAWGYS